jgi:hypothetical protein
MKKGIPMQTIKEVLQVGRRRVATSAPHSRAPPHHHTHTHTHTHTPASINGARTTHAPQSLVDDDMVRQEKIGASNYFW